MPGSWVGWVGWFWDKKSQEWMSVSTERELSDCHRQLIAYCDANGIEMRNTALTGGHRPTWKVED